MEQHVVAGLGEILWDVYPDGPRFGGAPANFACSAAALAGAGARVAMVGAVGDDDLGRRALRELAERRVDVSAIRTNEYPTGHVDVSLDDEGVASYEFASGAAWDHLDWTTAMEELARTTSAVCFGTLGQRSESSRDAILRFVRSTPPSALRVLDVNLRDPYWTSSTIRRSLELANVLKLNEDELRVLARTTTDRRSELDQLRSLAREHDLDTVALTKGAEGAIVVSRGAVSTRPSVSCSVVSTVGAGDAYTAALVLGMLDGPPLDETNQRAIEASGLVCSTTDSTLDKRILAALARDRPVPDDSNDSPATGENTWPESR